MKVSIGQHFIGGSLHGGADGFDLRQRVEPFEPVGTWPRANEAQVVEALEATRAGRAAWLALSAVERAECFRRVLEHLCANTAWSEHLKRYLGIGPRELESELATLKEWLQADELPAESAPKTSGSTTELIAELGIVFANWTELISGLFRRVSAQLNRDRGVVVISDSRWPVSGDALASALSSAGIPTGVVSVLHGLSAPLCDTLVELSASQAASESDEHATLRSLTIPIALDLGRTEGANRSIVVNRATEAEGKLASTAAQVVQEAFGRVATFSGQRPGRVARVICNVRVYSSFTEHLIQAMESANDIQSPIPLIDNDSITSVRALWNLGLDEGATLIFGGESFAPAPGSRIRETRVWPAIYSNVDPEMALSRFRETAPVLCLIRAETDEAAEALARDLDG